MDRATVVCIRHRRSVAGCPQCATYAQCVAALERVLTGWATADDVAALELEPWQAEAIHVMASTEARLAAEWTAVSMLRRLDELDPLEPGWTMPYVVGA